MLTSAVPVMSEDSHLVPPEQMRSALAERGDARQRNLDTLRTLLERPEAARAASALGADLDQARRALPALSDEEARDLAARAEALDVDPAAGLLGSVIDLLLIVVLVLLVILLLREVD
jgi:hypothetical protein